MLIVDCEVDGRPGLRVRVGETVEEVAADLRARPGEQVLDARGAAVVPGLHDHHLHLRALLARRTSVELDGRDLPATLRAAADTAPQGDESAPRWIRATGYHETSGRLDRDVLDGIVPERPVRVLLRTGEMWVLNSPALAAVGAATAPVAGIERDPTGRPTGRLMRLDAWLGRRVPHTVASDDDWRRLSDAALAAGVTGWTDATPEREDADLSAVAELVARGVVRQRLVQMAPVGARVGHGVRLGPVKLVLDDTALPTGEQLAEAVAAAHDDGRAAAVHCVTLAQLSVALDAFRRTGASDRDRIEHASVVAPVQVGELAALGVTVVTQPAFIRERGDGYLREVDEPERDWLYPCRSLADAGVPVAASSDAPHTDPDPWPAVAAAIDRRTRAGAVLGAGERMAPAEALRLYAGRADRPGTARRVAAGEPGDLCVLAAPLRTALAAPHRDAVAAVVLGGSIVHQA